MSGDTTKVLRFEIESHRQTELAIGVYLGSLAVSPDGALLAYTVRKSGRSVQVMPAAGGESREVSRTHATPLAVPITGGAPENMGISMNLIRFPRVHPDGRQIAFDSVVDTSELWTLDKFLPKAGAVR